MFSDPITLADASATNKSFSAIGFGSSSTTRTEKARTPDQPRTLFISHEKNGPKDNPVARRLVKLNATDKDASGNYHTCQVHVTITTPALVDSTGAVLDLVAMLKSFLTTANVEALLDGEV